MLYTNEQIQEISTEDYIFLTENFRLADENITRECVGYLLYNKRKRLIDTVRQVINNELTTQERGVAIDYWSGNLSIRDLANKYNIPRTNICRLLEKIKVKLDKSLKYVLFYNDAIKPPSTEEFLRQFKGEIYISGQIEN